MRYSVCMMVENPGTKEKLATSHREDDSLTVPCCVVRVKFKRAKRLTRFTDQVRRSMVALWNDMVSLHKRIRCAHWKWPAQGRLDAHFVNHKARYPGLPTACIQQAGAQVLRHSEDHTEVLRQRLEQSPLSLAGSETLRDGALSRQLGALERRLSHVGRRHWAGRHSDSDARPAGRDRQSWR